MNDRLARYFILILLFNCQFEYVKSNGSEADIIKDLSNVNERKDVVSSFKANIQLLGIDSNRIKLFKALDFAKKDNDLRSETEIFNLLGDYFSNISLSDSTIEYYQKALETGTKVDFNYYFPSLTQKIATKYWDKGSYNKALENALLLKDYYEKNNTLEDKEYLINLLGIIYQRLQDYPSAIEYLQQAAVIAEKKKNFGLLGVIYTNIGGVYFKQDKIVEALENYEKGVNLEVGNKQFLNAGRSYESMAKIYLALENPIKAEELLKQAINYNQSTSDIVGFTRTYVTYGRLYNYMKKYHEALEFLSKAEKFALKTDSKEYLMNTCEQLSLAYKNLKDFKSAISYQEKYISLYKQIYNIQDFAGIMKLENDLKIEKQNNELNRFRIEKQRAVLALLIIVALLFIIISILFILMYNRSNKSKKSLMLMNAEIQNQKDNLQRINDELEEARRNAENANQLKSHFLKNISHEIRTPLNGIVGLSELMVNETAPTTANQNYLSMIKNSSNRLLYTIDNIVELAHITTNQIHLHITSFDPKELMDEIYQHYSPFFQNCENRVLFKYSIDSKFKGTISSDKVLLKKIIIQLLDNATKFTSDGHITFGLEFKDEICRFYVRDTGIGISESSQKVIFESFRQEQDSLTREYEGVGIGLTIARKLSEILDADLNFESKKDQGTTFYLVIQHPKKYS